VADLVGGSRAPASNEIAPLQIQFGENQAQIHKRVFQQYPPVAVVPLSGTIY
jgi:hypothetical protein